MAIKRKGRVPDGAIKQGEVRNPKGENGHRKGWQPVGIRAKFWLEKLSYKQIRDIVTTPSKIDKYSSYDAIILRRIANCLTGNNTLANSEALFDRIEGKPKQTTAIEGPDGGPIKIDADDVLASIIRELDTIAARNDAAPPPAPPAPPAETDEDPAIDE